jgi:putative hydrolase of the HAD superfamily
MRWDTFRSPSQVSATPAHFGECSHKDTRTKDPRAGTGLSGAHCGSLEVVCHNHSMYPEDARRSAVTKLALFDLDNTLFDRANAYRAWARWFVETRGLGQADVEWFCEMDEDGFADRRTVWRKAKERFRLAESVDELLASYRSATLEACKPTRPVLDALESLRERGWRIGIVTNGPMPRQAEKANRLGLSPFLDAFCGSGELGVEKPDRRIFDEAIRRCADGGPLDQAASWMVGDAPIPDIAGGRAAGLRTIWLNRGRSWNPGDGDPPDVTVGTVVDAVGEILSQAI